MYLILLLWTMGKTKILIKILLNQYNWTVQLYSRWLDSRNSFHEKFLDNLIHNIYIIQKCIKKENFWRKPQHLINSRGRRSLWSKKVIFQFLFITWNLSQLEKRGLWKNFVYNKCSSIIFLKNFCYAKFKQIRLFETFWRNY